MNGFSFLGYTIALLMIIYIASIFSSLLSTAYWDFVADRRKAKSQPELERLREYMNFLRKSTFRNGENVLSIVMSRNPQDTYSAPGSGYAFHQLDRAIDFHLKIEKQRDG